MKYLVALVLIFMLVGCKRSYEYTFADGYGKKYFIYNHTCGKSGVEITYDGNSDMNTFTYYERLSWYEMYNKFPDYTKQIDEMKSQCAN
jgi:hypothetical protein